MAMNSPMMVPQTPHYQKCGHIPSNQDEEERWFILQVKVYGRDLAIQIHQGEFENSPTRFDEFTKYLEFLQSDEWDEWSSDGEDKAHEDGDISPQAPTLDLSVDGCYEWAVHPFLPLLEEIAPRPSEAGPITLQHFFSGERFEASLKAVDDVLIPGSIQTIDENDIISCGPGGSWKTASSIFQAREVEVLPDDPTFILIDEPTRVRVRGIDLFFKAFQDPDDSIGFKEVRTLEKIAKASFDQKELRTSRLYGIVEDIKSHVIGLLLHYIQVDDTLYGKITESGSLGTSFKDKWKRQVTSTVQTLHRTGIVWGDAKASNILVDTAGDAWVVDFGGGYTEGWVDSNKAGTIEGDLDGLRAIMDFIDTGREPGIMY